MIANTKGQSVIAAPSTQESTATPQRERRESNQWIRERRQARQLALQVLFEIDVTDHLPGAALDERLADERANGAGDFIQGERFLRWLVSGIIKQKAALDAMMQKYAPEWPVDQLAVIDRNVLRLALYEIGSHEADTPPKVVINEAVELGKLFGSDSSPRFINGVLGSALDEAMRKPF
jgi:N utilization substance protein B